MAARHPDRRRRRGRQLHRQLPEPVIGHARRALHRSANHSGAAAKVASRRSGGRGLPSRLSHSGVRPSHQPPAAVPGHSLSSPESRRQRDRTRDRCSAATEYRGTRRDSRPLRLWQWHRRTESGQNPAPVRVRPRWSSRIPTRIAHGFGHEHARVFMEAIGDRAAVPRWRSPHRTPRFLHNQFIIYNLRGRRDFRSPFRSQFRVGLNHTLQDYLRRLPTVDGPGHDTDRCRLGAVARPPIAS